MEHLEFIWRYKFIFINEGLNYGLSHFSIGLLQELAQAIPSFLDNMSFSIISTV